MSVQRRVDTEPELLVRRELHRAGSRYRVNLPIPGMPRRRMDIGFTGAQVAVFIDGCFWHSCPEHATRPKANGRWWQSKLAANVARDRATDVHLEALGWAVLRFWEHEPPVDVAKRIITTVATRRALRRFHQTSLRHRAARSANAQALPAAPLPPATEDAIVSVHVGPTGISSQVDGGHGPLEHPVPVADVVDILEPGGGLRW